MSRLYDHVAERVCGTADALGGGELYTLDGILCGLEMYDDAIEHINSSTFEPAGAAAVIEFYSNGATVCMKDSEIFAVGGKQPVSMWSYVVLRGSGSHTCSMLSAVAAEFRAHSVACEYHLLENSDFVFEVGMPGHYIMAEASHGLDGVKLVVFKQKE